MEIISREDAFLSRRGRFFTGVPCRRGHLAERYVSTGNCLECLRKFSRSPSTGYTSKLKGWTMDAMVYVPEMTPEQYEALTAYLIMCSHHWLAENQLLDDEMRVALGKLEAFRRKNVGVPRPGKTAKRHVAEPSGLTTKPARSAADIRK